MQSCIQQLKSINSLMRSKTTKSCIFPGLGNKQEGSPVSGKEKCSILCKPSKVIVITELDWNNNSIT